ncbi:MAG TPA: UvrD-helicase domain-containing protein [Burkholderiales bacterium]|nr:UvrD-helicase domain-containing protein [Burkholderiales bacterium]
MTADRIPDLDERSRALDSQRSFIVQAPAGSGKTGLLIQRFLLLLATVEAPEEIVAITFTLKAAGEMRERVLEGLASARAGAVPDGEHEARTLELARAAARRDAEQGWALAENPARLRIQTIDALCASFARQMPVLSRFGAAPAIIENASELYLEAARAVLELVESDQAVAADVERLLAHLDNDVGRVEGLLAGMLARRDHWIRYPARLERPALEAALALERERLVARTRELYPGTGPARADGWQALAESLLTKEGEWRKQSRPAQALAGASQSGALRDALGALRAMPPAAYGDAQWEVLGAIGRLLLLSVAQLKVVFQAQGQVDFTEVAQAALRAMGEEGAPTDLALALDYRIRHLLVDEFQDTSITQYELITRLTAGWEPGDGRTLFAVGDPMQSIYRFREAEVGEFLRTWERARLGDVALERVRLAANFRSQSGIVAWVNAAFARVMPAHEDAATGAVRYAQSAPAREALIGQAVEVHPFFDKDEAGEAARVVELVAGARRDEPEATIAVLVRNRGHLRDIVPQLRAAGLRFRAIEIDPLGERPVVQDLLALTRALAHPADRLAWLAVLRAPWCGLMLADLAALAERDDVRTVWELMSNDSGLSPDGRERLARARGVLAPALANRLRGSLRDQVEHAWFKLGGPACVADATDLKDAGIYLDALEGAEEAGALPDLAAFETRVAELWALPDVHARENDVQIMTIHRAKGLEFDHVIVPGLGRAPRADEKRLFLWMERPTPGGGPELLVAPIEETGSEGDAIYDWLRRLNAERDGHEATRLLYVAATRARRRLHLLGVVPVDDRSGVPREPSANTLLAKLWPVVAARFTEAAASRADRPAGDGNSAPAPVDQDLRRLPADWRIATAPAPLAWNAPADEPRVQDEIEFSWVGETARHVGSVVHRWLQRIADDTLAGWDEARIERLRPIVRAELAARDVREAEREAAVERALIALRRAIADPRGRWLLGPHPHASSEHRITGIVDGAVRRMVIDRLFRDEAGRRWVVDYKTSSHEGADVEAFLDRERERYAGQLANYARALGDVDQLGLYFPLLAGWRES